MKQISFIWDKPAPRDAEHAERLAAIEAKLGRKLHWRWKRRKVKPKASDNMAQHYSCGCRFKNHKHNCIACVFVYLKRTEAKHGPIKTIVTLGHDTVKIGSRKIERPRWATVKRPDNTLETITLPHWNFIPEPARDLSET